MISMMDTEFPKQAWKQRLEDIAKSRSWTELDRHFSKHLGEMAKLDAKAAPDRATKKAFSLVNLCMISIMKMGVPAYFIDFLDAFPHDDLLDRIKDHDQYLKEQAEAERKRKEDATNRKKAAEDSDTD